MKRRDFLYFVCGLVSSTTFSSAQPIPTRIGLLASGAAGSRYSENQIAAIHEGLHNNGLQEGRDYILDTRFAAGTYTRFPALARELAMAGSKVILANTIASVRAAQKLDPPIPVVMLSINDPVGARLVESLPRPGRNTTGLANLNEDLSSKLLEFQREVVPKAKTVAVLFNPQNSTNPRFLEKLRAQAAGLGMNVVAAELSSPDVLNAALSDLASNHPDALHLMSDSGIFDLSDRIAEWALSMRLPSFATFPDFATLGGMMAYGSSRRELFIRSGYFVKRILDGAPPGDLPVEQPTRAQLWVNLKTTKSIGVDLPVYIQQLADQTIE
jgi:putative ABC transport system substrate-binding protein